MANGNIVRLIEADVAAKMIAMIITVTILVIDDPTRKIREYRRRLEKSIATLAIIRAEAAVKAGEATSINH